MNDVFYSCHHHWCSARKRPLPDDLRLSNAARGDNVHFGNLHPEDRDHVYEVQIKGFDECTKSDQDIQHDLGNMVWALLADAGCLISPVSS